MYKIYQHSICYSKTTKEIVCYVIAPYTVTSVNKNNIHAYARVHQKPDIEVKISKNEIDKPIIGENTDKVFTVNMWSKDNRLSGNDFKDFFSEILTQLYFPIPESLQHILKP